MRSRLKSWRRTLLVIGTVIAVLLASPIAMLAQFGFGGIVYDPTVAATVGHIWTQDISNYAKMVETVTTLQHMYATALQDYTLAQSMAQRIHNRSSWLTLATTHVNEYTQNRYGETVNWGAVMSGDPVHAAQGYLNATTRLSPNVNLTHETLGQSTDLANLASIESIDSSNTACYQAVAQYRANQQQNRQSSDALDANVTDETDATNGEVGQLNQLNGALAQQRAEAQSRGTLQACLVEQQALANTIRRNQLVDSLNTFAQVQQDRQAHPMEITSMDSAWNAAIQ